MDYATERIEIEDVNRQVALAALRDIWLQMSRTSSNVKLPRVFPPTELHQPARPWDERGPEDIIAEVASKGKPLLLSVYPPAGLLIADQVRPAISIVVESTHTGVIVVVDLIDQPYPLTLILYRQLVLQLRNWAIEQERQHAESDVMAQVAQALDISPSGQQPSEKRGMKIGTAERVREMHRLLKSGLSQREAKGQARCDPSTYYKWCKDATGEEPIVPYR